MSKKIVQVEEEIEGNLVETDDYIFDKIGEAFPIRTDDFTFDPQSSPSRPLAVSEKHGLLFVAHSSGFFVARTRDVMASAAEIKEKGRSSCSSSSIQQLSVVDVPLAKLHILALSTDNYTLVATADSDIHFFSVGSLLDKCIEPSYSCSLSDSSSVKDMQWTKKSENIYVLLSNLGKLYHGTVGGPLKDLMDNVDAVEWSLKGKLIAVARKDTLYILSSNFVEKSSMLLSFKSWLDDPDTNSIIKDWPLSSSETEVFSQSSVDTIRWVRSDSIILGYFQLNADGNEENYLVQVIQIKDGKFTNESCKPVVRSFYDMFSCIIDDILPSGSGPYLLLSYLEECELAITANKKNADQHVVYLSWSLGEENNEAVIVDIVRDNLKPRIELQENGDDNLILGLCMDKISVSQKVSVGLGMEQRELSPYCILICLTLDGKLIMYHVASVSGDTVKPASVSSSDEEEDSAALGTVGCEPAKLSPDLQKEQFGKLAVEAPWADKDIKELDRIVSLHVLTKDDQKSLALNETSVLKEESTYNNKKVEPLTRSQSFKGQQELIFSNPHLNKNGKQMQLPVQENKGIPHACTDSFSQDGDSLVFRNLSKTGTQKNSVLGTSSVSFVETGVKSLGKMESTDLQMFSSQSSSSGEITSSMGTDAKSPSVPSTFIKGSRSGTSTTLSFSGMPVENRGRRSSTAGGNIASVPPVPPISSFQMSSQEMFLIDKSFNHKIYPVKENHREHPHSRMPNSEPSLSKKFGNITEMTRELDMFLQSIEEPGGFRDACIVNQRSSVETLEREVGILYERCRIWKGTMNERLNEVQHLFDMTIQVLARKIYMDGIVKQASDSQYWDFWSGQKLSSELELKRRHISKMNQDLTDQLIRLERHFNGLELNKFGENDRVHAGQSSSQSRFGHSRHTQSLHSLHSTMTSQLAAADQLSECLSKQMVALKIEPPSVKQKNVKKELFETIGITYDASFSSPSPDVSKFRGTPKEKLSFSLGSSTAKDRPRRNSSATKNYEPETARRRRDSLDRSWANYEPTKATVKRLLLQESGKVSVNRSSLSADKQRISPRLERSAVTHPQDHTVPATLFHPSENKGIQDTHSKQALENPATPFVFPKESARQNFMREINQTAENSGGGIISVKKSESVSAREKFVFPSDTSQNPYTFMVPTQTAPVLKKTYDMPNSSPENGVLPIENSLKDRPLNTTIPSPESGKKHNSPFSSSFLVSVAPSATSSMSVSAPPSSIFSSSSASLSSVSSASSTLPSLPSLMSPNRPLTNSKTTADMNKPVSTSFPVSAFPSPVVVPSGSFSMSVSKSPLPSDIAPATKSASESPDTEIQPLSKTAVNSNTIVPPVDSGPSPAETNPNLKPLILPPVTVENSTGLAPDNQSSFSNASPAPVVAPGSQPSLKNTSGPTLNVIVNAQQEQTSAGQSLFPAALSNSGSAASRTIDVQNAQEDDMDEEAPDTSSLVGLDFGSLGAFELGSSPNPTAAKPNPFGGSFGNAATNVATSPFPMTVPSGGLFQPASLNFQSLHPSPSSQPANPGAFASGFGTSTTAPYPSPGGFGQPSQVGPGQQALGSVLGAFGQSRQLGTALPGTGFGSPGGFGGGIASNKPTGGLSDAATGGFAGASSTVGGFAAVASGGGGFAALASGAGGFGGASSGFGGFGGAASGFGGFGGAASGGPGFGGAASGGSGFGGAAAGGSGFGGAAPAGSGFAGANAAGGGFGAFGGQQGSGGFSAFGSGGTGKPPDLLFQMRK
ncbi:nuclear pore complex protein NUP214 isoform X2 [Argentina anserina]|uniref:nuclear pore complex protein NUP214 isoform X2 n=1 Tax=Argentina anserina TaxID=57926 RepID=UPI002176936F|nr:nuclear pore complex protein NUP214 isoform X2 [Potentilla anserina]